MQKPNGEEWELQIEKDYREDLGIEFENMTIFHERLFGERGDQFFTGCRRREIPIKIRLPIDIAVECVCGKNGGGLLVDDANILRRHSEIVAVLQSSNVIKSLGESAGESADVTKIAVEFKLEKSLRRVKIDVLSSVETKTEVLEMADEIKLDFFFVVAICQCLIQSFFHV